MVEVGWISKSAESHKFKRELLQKKNCYKKINSYGSSHETFVQACLQGKRKDVKTCSKCY